MSFRYDPDQDPDPAGWLETPEDLRLEAIQRHHHARAANERMHAAIHVVVENQLALGEPAPVRTLRRLREAGLTRHDAIHAIGSVVATQVFSVLKEGTPYDAAAYEADLDRLDPAEWVPRRRRR